MTNGDNAQVAVKAKRSLIVEQRINTVAGHGLTQGQEHRRLRSLRSHASPHKGVNVSNDLFPEERFRYDPVADAYHGFGGRVVDARYSSMARAGHDPVCQPAACAGCQTKALCTSGRWRRVTRRDKEEIIERRLIRAVKSTVPTADISCSRWSRTFPRIEVKI